MIITDSGLHVWQASTPERPWDTSRAHTKDPISYEDLRVRMAGAGVDRAVLVPPSFAGARNDYSLEAATKYPKQFAVMASVPLNKPKGRQVLEDLKGRPGFLGVRLTFHHEKDESWVRDGTAAWFWPLAEKMNIAVMMNAPTNHKEIGEVAQRHPGLRLIFDHMGVKGAKDDKLIVGLANMMELAEHPNIFVKLTLAPICSSEPYPYRNIHLYLRQLMDAFTPHRCFWGSDLSSLLRRSKGTYREAVTMFTEEMDFLSKEDLEWVMGRALAECLPWPVDAKLMSSKAA